MRKVWSSSWFANNPQIITKYCDYYILCIDLRFIPWRALEYLYNYIMRENEWPKLYIINVILTNDMYLINMLKTTVEIGNE